MSKHLYGLRAVEYVTDHFAGQRAQRMQERLRAATTHEWVETDPDGRTVFCFTLDGSKLRNTEAHGIASVLGYITNTCPATEPAISVGELWRLRSGHTALVVSVGDGFKTAVPVITGNHATREELTTFGYSQDSPGVLTVLHRSETGLGVFQFERHLATLLNTRHVEALRRDDVDALPEPWGRGTMPLNDSIESALMSAVDQFQALCSQES